VCSDDNLCNGVESCVAEAGTCGAPAVPQLCTPGNKRAKTTCAAEWFIDNPNNPKGVLSKAQLCHQGDPSCDHDADLATCGFRVALCLRVPDPRFAPACTPRDVASYRLQRPSASRDPLPANALHAALAAFPGAGAGAHDDEHSFTPPIAAVHCTAPVIVPVPLGKSKSVRGMATTVDGMTDRDGLRLKCVP
jgi:hypothetical protein